jgi:ribonuclease BN (tRNA processing enzyme)
MNKNLVSNIKMPEKPLKNFTDLNVGSKRKLLNKMLWDARTKFNGNSYKKYQKDIDRAQQPKLLDIYNTLKALEKSKETKVTYKKVQEVKHNIVPEKKEKKQRKKYVSHKPKPFDVHVLLYKVASDEDKKNTKAKKIKKYGETYVQISNLVLDIKANEKMLLQCKNPFITQRVFISYSLKFYSTCLNFIFHCCSY